MEKKSFSFQNTLTYIPNKEILEREGGGEKKNWQSK